MIGYIFATGNAWDSTTSYVSKLNMNTETNAGAATSMAATEKQSNCNVQGLHVRICTWWW